MTISTMEAHEIIITAIGSGGAALTGKIVWDWLKNRKEDKPISFIPCPLHDTVVSAPKENKDRIRELENILTAAQKDMMPRGEALKLFDTVFTKLDNIKDEMGNIRVCIAAKSGKGKGSNGV